MDNGQGDVVKLGQLLECFIFSGLTHMLHLDGVQCISGGLRHLARGHGLRHGIPASVTHLALSSLVPYAVRL